MVESGRVGNPPEQGSGVLSPTQSPRRPVLGERRGISPIAGGPRVVHSAGQKETHSWVSVQAPSSSRPATARP